MARMPGATWRPISVNHTKGGISARLLIFHTMEGTLSGTDSWFRNSSSRVSSHFGVGKNGTIYQWVDTSDRAWANAGANSIAISIENEGTGSEPLTEEQIEANAAIYAWSNQVHGVPLQYASSATGSGLGYHRQFSSWSLGGTSCPGNARIGQRTAIMERAVEIRGGSVPDLPPPGSYNPPSSGGMTSVRSILNQQKAANEMGYTPRLVEDGIWGPKTNAGVRWAQGQLKVTVDGLWGQDTERAYKNRDSSGGGDNSGGSPVSGRKFPLLTVDGIRGNQTNRALQTYLGVSVDGIVGPQTIRALQRKVGASVDGIWGRETTRSLQTALNNGTF